MRAVNGARQDDWPHREKHRAVSDSSGGREIVRRGGGGIALACCQCAFFLGIMMMRLLSVRVRFDACVFDIYSLALFRYLERGTKGSRVRSSAGYWCVRS